MLPCKVVVSFGEPKSLLTKNEALTTRGLDLITYLVRPIIGKKKDFR